MNLPSGKLEKSLAIIFDSVTLSSSVALLWDWVVTWLARVTWQERAENGRELQTLITVKGGMVSLDHNCFLDFSSIPVILLVKNFDIVQSAAVSTVIEVFFHSRVYTFSSSVFFKPDTKVSACLPNIVVVTVFTLDVIHKPALVLFRCFVLGLD